MIRPLQVGIGSIEPLVGALQTAGAVSVPLTMVSLVSESGSPGRALGGEHRAEACRCLPLLSGRARRLLCARREAQGKGNNRA